MTKEQKFFKALQDIFIGAKIEGEGGFINLMKIKSGYYSQVEKLLQKDINKALEQNPAFRDELFDKLFSFFNRYFTESGSIYFNSTPFHNNIYERVYTDDKDMILFWKTQMLYYVKTDRIFRSLPVEFDGFKFYFDAGLIDNKKANEKRTLIFELKQIRDDGTIVFSVKYSERGTKTKSEDILKVIKKKNVGVTEEFLERAFSIFEKQSEVDFFINKNAKSFLEEQFKLWSYQYYWDGAKEWTSERVNQLQILKNIAFNIISFIARFENELVKIWNKPKFVRNSNYVITLDRISDSSLIDRIFKHPGFQDQLKEWQVLGIVDEKFKSTDILNNKKFDHLPIDTKYFKNLGLDILSLFNDLDLQLDGWLIKSENYQALNTILPKFKGKVQTIYSDPPFNLDSSDKFLYRTNYKNSNWATLLENRLMLSKNILSEKGNIFVRCDYNGNWIVRCLLDNIFDENLKNELIINRGKQRLGGLNKYSIATDSLFYYVKNDSISPFSAFKRERYQGEASGTNMLMKGERFPRERTFKDPDGNEVILIPPADTHWKFIQTKINNMYRKEVIYLAKSRKGFGSGIMKVENGEKIPVDYVPSFTFDEEKTIDSNWTDIAGYSADWNFDTENSETLLQRVIVTGNPNNGIVLDYFLGSGTTISVSQKLSKKWIGVDMGEHFNTTILPRMKEVLASTGKHEPIGISKSTNWQGGGFFKYYELEQYEESLKNSVYQDSDLLDKASDNKYLGYIFLRDEKMLKTLDVNYESNKVKVDLSQLYPDIDIPETISNLTGKWIKAIRKDEVEFADGTKFNTKELDYRIIKPLIWWD